MGKFSPLLLAPLVFCGFVALVAVGMFREDPEGLPSTLIGQQAPPVAQAALPGHRGATDETLRSGALTIVNFWASWCPPCRAEHPRLLALQAEGFRIVGVNYKDTAEDGAGYLAEDGNPFIAVPVDPVGRMAIDWGVTAPPETFVVAGDGTVIYRLQGPLVGTAYEAMFRPALERALQN